MLKTDFYERKLIFLRIGKKICSIQKYKCKKCGKTFYTDLSSLVYDNSNITFTVFDCIENLYQIYGAGLHKIRYYLKKQHNVEISHQSIENILLSSDYAFDDFIMKILWKFIIPYFKKLTTHLENNIIPSTNNKIENIFQKDISKTHKKRQ